MPRRKNSWNATSERSLSRCRRSRTRLKRQRRDNEQSHGFDHKRDEQGGRLDEKTTFEIRGICVGCLRTPGRFAFCDAHGASATGARQGGAVEPSAAAESRAGEQGGIAGATAPTAG